MNRGKLYIVKNCYNVVISILFQNALQFTQNIETSYKCFLSPLQFSIAYFLTWLQKCSLFQSTVKWIGYHQYYREIIICCFQWATTQCFREPLFKIWFQFFQFFSFLLLKQSEDYRKNMVWERVMIKVWSDLRLLKASERFPRTLMT